MPVIRPADTDTPTPPEGLDVSGLITAEDFGTASPAVFGAEDQPGPHGDAGEWPTLEYRSRAKQERPGRGGFTWRRDREQ